MKNYFKILVLQFLLTGSFDAKANIDSLLKVIKQQKHDTTKASSYLELTRLIIYDNQILAKQYCNEGLSYALKSNWRNTYIFYAHLATIHQLNNQHDSAIYFNKLNYDGAIKVGNSYNEAIALNNIASACIYANKLDDAYTYAEKAVAANIKVNNKLGLAISRQIIGTIENDYGNSAKAIAYLQLARKNFIEANDAVYASSILITIADIYLNANKPDSTIYYLNICKKEIGNLADAYFYGSFYEQVGRYFMRVLKPSEALINFNLAYKYAKQAGSTTHLVGLSLQKARALFELKQYKQALALVEPNLQFAIDGHLYDVANGCALVTSKIHEQNGMHKIALHYYKIHKQYSDSIINTEKNKRIALMSVRFSTQQKEQENLLLQAESANKGKLIKLISTIAILVLLFIVSITLIINNNRSKTAKLNQELKALNQTKDKLFGVISHDLRGPLSTTEMMAFLISKKNLEPNEVKKYANELGLLASKTSTLLDNMLNWAHSQLDGININKQNANVLAVVSECLNLLSAQIEKKELNIQNNISEAINIDADIDILRFVLRNLLSNAIKFSAAGQTIIIDYNNQNKAFTITDYGVGIDEQKLKLINNINNLNTLTSSKGTLNEKGAGLGIMLIKTFLKAHGGYLKAIKNITGTSMVFKL